MTEYYWHVHHTVLCEPLTEPIENRIAYIKASKREAEIETRLRLMAPVRGKLPAAYAKARAAYAKAGAAYDKVRAAYDKARAAALPEIEALHALECPNCPWDAAQQTIFPRVVTT